MPSASPASSTSAHRRAAISDRRSPPINSSPAITASRRPRAAATWSDSTPRPRRRGRWHVASTAARSAALNGRSARRTGPPGRRGGAAGVVELSEVGGQGRVIELLAGEPGVELAEGAGVGAAGVCAHRGVDQAASCGRLAADGARSGRVNPSPIMVRPARLPGLSGVVRRAGAAPVASGGRAGAAGRRRALVARREARRLESGA